VHRTHRVSQHRRVPGQYITLRCSCNEALAFFHPFDGKERVFLFMEGLSDELWRGGLPVVARLLVKVGEVLRAVALMGHDCWAVLHIEVCLPVVPVVVLTGLHVQLVLLLITELYGVWV